MKPVGHPMRQLHQRDGAGLDIPGIEHRQIAAVFAAAVNSSEHPAIALGRVVAPCHEHRLGDAIAGRQLLMPHSRTRAVAQNA